jgi:hypothetical protein
MADQITDVDQLSKHPLATINKLIIKALEARNTQSFLFVVVNDTYQLMKYDQAIVWRIQKDKVKMLAISGQTTVNAFSEMHLTLTDIVDAIKDKGTAQMIDGEKLSQYQDKWETYQKQNQTGVLWLPIYSDKKLVLGLWLEKWNVTKQEEPDPKTMSLLQDYLLKGYGAAWSKHTSKFGLGKMKAQRILKFWLLLGVVLLVLVSFIRVPLRIAAPCEVIPKEPYIVTAPLEGVISEIVVHPGDRVNKGEPLVKYDARVPQRELNIVEKEMEIAKAKLSKSETGGIRDPQVLQDLEINRLQLERAKVSYNYQKQRFDLLTIDAPVAGIVVIESPDEWRGRPVQVGEKIMTIIDLASTKVKMWVPADDNIEFNKEASIRIFLNANPAITFTAKLDYISSEVVLSDTNVPSFIAEAEWEHADSATIKPGSKGTAILSGEKVSLFYYVARKPFAYLRRKLGM